MNEQMMKERIQQALNAQMSGVRTSPAERSELFENAIGGRKVKRKLTAGLVFAMVLVLMTAAAVATILLTQQQVMEQVGVPLAVQNDGDLGTIQSYSAEELAQLVRNLEENGYALEENNEIIQAIRLGEEYYEEEVLMEICRQAFGGNFGTWTLEQQDWFRRMTVEIGFSETYDSEGFLPTKDNMTYEQAEAFAFSAWKKAYGEDLKPEDRTLYQLERSFCAGGWDFALLPRDVELGRYTASFSDEDPEGSLQTDAEIPDWTKPYDGRKLLNAFRDVYGWSQGKWPRSAWQKLHEMMQKAELSAEDDNYREYKAYQLTEYPDPAEGELSREEAVRIAKEALKAERSAFDSAVLTAYEGKRTWLVGMITAGGEGRNRYVISVDSATGSVESVREYTPDDDGSLFCTPEAAYRKAAEGWMSPAEREQFLRDAVAAKYPELDLKNEAEYELRVWSGEDEDSMELHFRTRNIHHGDVTAIVSRDGTVGEVTADTEELNGDNLYERYQKAHRDDDWDDQNTWVRLGREAETLEPAGIEGKLLKMSRFPEESSVRIGREEAMKLVIKASGKRTAEILHCVLTGSDPHPVWKMRVATYDDPEESADKLYELDAETGDILFTEPYKTDFTPAYALFSSVKNRRAVEMKDLGPEALAVREAVYAFAEMEMDEPDLGLEDPEQYEVRAEGLTFRWTGRWAGMKDYLVELDENGNVIRCEQTDSQSTAVNPALSDETDGEEDE